MDTPVLVTAAFAVLTATLVAWQVRRKGGGPRAVCPRCRGEVPAGASRCPGCDVPMQVFEIAAAEVATAPEADAADGAEGAVPHAIVRADVCVGCGCCVPVCPEAGAIRLEGKLAIVEKDLCKGHGKCAEACPVGGIVIATGAAVHRVTVPDLKADFQSNVPGVYIVGELGGRGLIKNAINEGRVAAENVARDLRGCRNGSCGGLHDLVIVGSGPAGLSAALTSQKAGLDFVILDQGNLADTIRKYPRHKLLLAEPIKVPLYGDLWVADASKETLLSVWEAMVEQSGLKVLSNRRVEEVSREGSVLTVRGADFAVRARRVILALGRRGTPRRLGVPGEESAKVFYDIVEMEEFKGRKVLVVGGGDSALESALGLANQEGTEVVLSHRKSDFDRAKERNRQKLSDAERSGRLRILRESAVKAIRPDAVEIETGGRVLTLPNDDVIVRIGGEPPAAFLEKAGIRMVTKAIPLEEAKAGAPA